MQVKRFTTYEQELQAIPDLHDNPPVMGAVPSEIFGDRGVVVPENGGNEPEPTPEGFVDFGLSSGTLWAKTNLGATNGNTAESYYGGYYAWGELETKTYYDWQNYQHANGADNKLTKYCYDSEYGNEGYTDELTQLVPEDDIATVTNSAWRMPTQADFEELIAGTSSSWVENYNNIEGLNGRVFIKATITRPAFKNIPLYVAGQGEVPDEAWAEFSIYTLEETNAMIGGDIREMLYKDAETTILAEYDTDYGFVEKETDPAISMFIPAAGSRYNSFIDDVGSNCNLWSSSLYLDYTLNAYYSCFDSGHITKGGGSRCEGFSVRPVINSIVNK